MSINQCGANPIAIVTSLISSVLYATSVRMSLLIAQEISRCICDNGAPRDQNGLGYHSKWGLCRTKNSNGHDFDSHTHAYSPTLPKTPRISATIKSKFNLKNIFPDIVYNVKNKIDFAKNRGRGRAPSPLDPPLTSSSLASLASSLLGLAALWTIIPH